MFRFDALSLKTNWPTNHQSIPSSDKKRHQRWNTSDIPLLLLLSYSFTHPLDERNKLTGRLHSIHWIITWKFTSPDASNAMMQMNLVMKRITGVDVSSGKRDSIKRNSSVGWHQHQHWGWEFVERDWRMEPIWIIVVRFLIYTAGIRCDDGGGRRTIAWQWKSISEIEFWTGKWLVDGWVNGMQCQQSRDEQPANKCHPVNQPTQRWLQTMSFTYQQLLNIRPKAREFLYSKRHDSELQLRYITINRFAIHSGECVSGWIGCDNGTITITMKANPVNTIQGCACSATKARHKLP